MQKRISSILAMIMALAIALTSVMGIFAYDGGKIFDSNSRVKDMTPIDYSAIDWDFIPSEYVMTEEEELEAMANSWVEGEPIIYDKDSVVIDYSALTFVLDETPRVMTEEEIQEAIANSWAEGEPILYDISNFIIDYSALTFVLDETPRVFTEEEIQEAIANSWAEGEPIIYDSAMLTNSNDEVIIGNNGVMSVMSVPSMPASASASWNSSSDTVSASWSSVSGVTGYHLYVDNTYVTSAPAGYTSGSMDASALANGTYTFGVSAYNSNGESGKKTASFTVSRAGSPPSAPSSASASYNSTTDRIDASWSSVSGVTGYKLYINNGTPVTVGNILSGDLDPSALASGVTHTLGVSAYNSVGESSKSMVNFMIPNRPVSLSDTQIQMNTNSTVSLTANQPVTYSIITSEPSGILTLDWIPLYKANITSSSNVGFVTVRATAINSNTFADCTVEIITPGTLGTLRYWEDDYNSIGRWPG